MKLQRQVTVTVCAAALVLLSLGCSEDSAADVLGAPAADGGEVNISDEVGRLEAKVEQVLHQIYDKLTPWQKIQVARHPDRPHFSAYLDGLIDDFTELHGDRAYGDDRALIGGIGNRR